MEMVYELSLLYSSFFFFSCCPGRIYFFTGLLLRACPRCPRPSTARPAHAVPQTLDPTRPLPTARSSSFSGGVVTRCRGEVSILDLIMFLRPILTPFGFTTLLKKKLPSLFQGVPRYPLQCLGCMTACGWCAVVGYAA